MHVGKWLKKVRMESDVSQAELARRLGISTNSLYRMEKKEDFRVSTIERYLKAIACGCQVMHMPIVLTEED